MHLVLMAASAHPVIVCMYFYVINIRNTVSSKDRSGSMVQRYLGIARKQTVRGSRSMSMKNFIINLWLFVVFFGFKKLLD